MAEDEWTIEELPAQPPTSDPAAGEPDDPSAGITAAAVVGDDEAGASPRREANPAPHVSLLDWVSQLVRHHRVVAVSVATEPEPDGTPVGEDLDGVELEANRSGDSIVRTWMPSRLNADGSATVRRRGPGGRRRRANAEGGRRHSHQVLVSPREEARLQVLAARTGVTIPRLLVEAAFAPETQTVSERRATGVELMALHRKVAGIANNINQQARHANTTFELSSELKTTLKDVRSIMVKIDAALELLIELNRQDGVE